MFMFLCSSNVINVSQNVILAKGMYVARVDSLAKSNVAMLAVVANTWRDPF